MPLNRRNFLKIIATSFIGSSLISCTHKKFFNPDEDILLAGGRIEDENKQQNLLVIINLTQREKKLIETPFLPHGIYIHPGNKYRVFCFEKNADKACEIDLQTQRVTRSLQAEQGHVFSGHASFSHDGKSIYCIESNTANFQGSITVRNTETFAISHQLPTLGLSPHDCQLSKDNILTVSNTGKSESGFHLPSLVSIDIATEKLIERIKLDTDDLVHADLNCGHFKISDTNDLVIASAPISTKTQVLSGGVSIRKYNEPISTMKEPEVVIKRMTGEALSIEINQQQSIAAITHPAANLLTFWSIKDKKIIKAIGFENPRGLSQTLDKKYFIVSYGEQPAMAKISTNDLEPQVDSIVRPTLASGEHIINWSKTIREIMPTRIYD
ncbi:MAG: hypothetical protein DRQ44_05325 [Gammaproteobacteria bacterium]|nr:MAG: hypothetical protein DRQ44_05325 [Gammaproteobacteria bacterium]